MKLFVLTVIVFLLSACSAAPAADQQPQATPTNLSFGGLMASMQATEEPMVPTQEPEPTIDTQATINALYNLQISATQTKEYNDVLIAQAAADGKQAELDAEYARSTQSESNRAAAERNLSAQSTQLSIQATMTQDGRNFAEHLPTLAAAGTRSSFTGAQEMTNLTVTWVMISGVLVVIALALFYLFSQLRFATMDQAKTQPEPAPEELPAEDHTRTINRASGSSTFPTVFQDHIPPELATDQQLEWIANGVIRDGKKLSHAQWTPAWKNGFSEPGFTAFQYFLVEVGMAQWVDPEDHRAGAEHTDDFINHFSKLLTDGLSSPSGSPANPENENQPAKKSIDTHFSGGAVGGWVVTSPEQEPDRA